MHTWLHAALAALVFGIGASMPAGPAVAQETGYAVKKPVLGAACHTCIWGPIATVVEKAMKPYGWDAQICWNCNLADSPRHVAYANRPPKLTPRNIALGDLPPPNGPVDFGITNSHMLLWLYNGVYMYASDKPQKQLRVIAQLEDVYYMTIAVKKDSGITDLRQIREKRLPVRILSEETLPTIVPVLEYYGLTKEAMRAQGGDIVEPRPENRGNFDVIVTAFGGLANNNENQLLYETSQKYDLVYLELPDELRDKLATTYGLEKVEMPWGMLRGSKTNIRTVARNGQSIYARADAPDDFVYTLAKAMDENQGQLKFLIRPFYYNTRTVAKPVGGVPLHPAAERYYREVGYLK